MSKGLKALERLMVNYYEMCQDLGNNDDQYQRCNLTSERAIIEKELKESEKSKREIEKSKREIEILHFIRDTFSMRNALLQVCDKNSKVLPERKRLVREYLLKEVLK